MLAERGSAVGRVVGVVGGPVRQLVGGSMGRIVEGERWVDGRGWVKAGWRRCGRWCGGGAGGRRCSGLRTTNGAGRCGWCSTGTLFGRDTALLPCAEVGYLFYEPEGDDEPGWDTVHMACGEAAYRDEIEATVQSLRADGWRVVGRLHLSCGKHGEATFVGCWTEEDFWARTEAVLREREG